MCFVGDFRYMVLESFDDWLPTIDGIITGCNSTYLSDTAYKALVQP